VRVLFYLPGGGIPPTPISAEIDRDGALFVTASVTSTQTFIAKLDALGNPVPGFDSGPVRTLDCAVGDTLELDATGSLFLGGSCSGDEGPRAAVARIDSRGALVQSFGSGGIVRDVFGEAGAVAGALATSAHGSVYALLRTRDNFRVAKMDPSGRLDSAFGNGGFATFDVACDLGRRLAVDQAGLLYVSGYSTVSCPTDRSAPGYGFSVFRLGG
jgi:hypothetical protein